MKCIPILRCNDPERSLHFYTTTLDFKLKYPGATATDPVITLINHEIELQLCAFDGSREIIVNIFVDEIDALFEKYIKRGLDTTHKKQSSVHTAPIDQTWGTREFYVTDADNHTLRFCEPIK